jgi:hypothetical protein
MPDAYLPITPAVPREMRGLDKPLPLKGWVSEENYRCLRRHGFYCGELKNDLKNYCAYLPAICGGYLR